MNRPTDNARLDAALALLMGLAIGAIAGGMAALVSVAAYLGLL